MRGAMYGIVLAASMGSFGCGYMFARHRFVAWLTHLASCPDCQGAHE